MSDVTYRDHAESPPTPGRDRPPTGPARPAREPTAPTPLARALEGGDVGSHHWIDVEASVEDTWAALHALRWADLPALGRGARRRGAGGRGSSTTVLEGLSRTGVLEEEPPRYSALAMIGRPWSPDPRAHVAVDGLRGVAHFDEPGWLKYGMEWVLEPLAPTLTRLRTATLCTATDERTRRAFAAYWVVIRPFSGLLRTAMLTTVRRLATRPAPGRGRAGRRLPPHAHTDRPWLIHAIAPDFTLEDVWLIDVHGSADELSRLLHAVIDDGFPDRAPVAVRALWKARWIIGGVLGWDRPDEGLGTRVSSLRGRLPDGVATAAPGSDLPGVPFTTLYETRDEWAAEVANKTVHGVMHLGWVPDGNGGYRGQMAVLVRPNGALGRLYMALIKPLRYGVVYPALLRGIEKRWMAERG